MIGKSVRIFTGHNHFGYQGVVKCEADIGDFLVCNQEVVFYEVEITQPEHAKHQIAIFSEACLS